MQFVQVLSNIQVISQIGYVQFVKLCDVNFGVLVSLYKGGNGHVIDGLDVMQDMYNLQCKEYKWGGWKPP